MFYRQYERRVDSAGAIAEMFLLRNRERQRRALSTRRSYCLYLCACQDHASLLGRPKSQQIESLSISMYHKMRSRVLPLDRLVIVSYRFLVKPRFYFRPFVK